MSIFRRTTRGPLSRNTIGLMEGLYAPSAKGGTARCRAMWSRPAQQGRPRRGHALGHAAHASLARCLPCGLRALGAPPLLLVAGRGAGRRGARFALLRE